MIVETLLCAVIAAILFYRYAIKNNRYFRDRKMPHLKPAFLLGNTGEFFMKKLRPNEFLHQMYNAMPLEKIYGFFLFRTPTLFVTDPQLIKQITVKDFDHFTDHSPLIRTSEEDVFGQTLLMLGGEKWRQMRATLSPAFTGSKMRQMFELVADCGAEMCVALRARPSAGLEELDMKELFGRYANDVIATTAFGISVNSFENNGETNEFLMYGRRMLDGNRSATKLIMLSLFPWLMRKAGVQVVDAKTLAFFRRMVVDTMETRKRLQIVRPDVINLLMQLRDGVDLTKDEPMNAEAAEGVATAENVAPASKNGVKRAWTDDEILAQCMLFFVAGFDTMSTALATLSYELATNVEVQQRLYEECDAVQRRLKDGGVRTVPYDVLQEMQYLDQVVAETLRMWPPSLITERMCVKDYVYDDGELRFEVADKTSIWIPVYALHHDGRYFADADRFDPERFGAERRRDIVPGTYMPFGAGPRNCIASRFALMEMKAAVYHMVLQFRFEPCAKTQIPLLFAKNPGAFETEKGIHLTLKKRNNHCE